MTNADWQTCEDPRPLMEVLITDASPRRRWLFACACCRAVWPLLPPRCREAVEAVERFADGKTDDDELLEAFHEFLPQEVNRSAPGGEQAVKSVAHLGQRWRSRTQGVEPWNKGDFQAFYTLDSVSRSAAESLAKTIPWREARRRQCELLRELMRHPDEGRLAIDPSWLTCNAGAARALAASIYDERAFDHLPILADALEDAGCADADLLGHCRSAEAHLRGCWAIDALLGRA